MIGNVLPLTVDVNARGVARVASELGRVEQSVGRVGRAAGGVHTVMGRMGGVARSAFGGVGRALGAAGGWMGQQIRGLPGMIGMGFGVAGLVSLVRETADYERSLVAMQLALRMTDEETVALDKDMARLAKETGLSRTELLAATRAATDYGTGWEKAVEGMRDAALLAKIMDVPLESLSPALGGIEKLSGGKLSSRQQMALLYEAQDKSGMPEGALLSLIGKIGPALAGLTGGDQQGLGFLMANVAAVGEAFAGDPGKMKRGLQSLVQELNNPQRAKLWERLGINTDDLAGAEGKLLSALAGGDKEVEKLPGNLLLFLETLLNTEGGLERFNNTYKATTGDLTASTDRVAEAMDKMEGTAAVTWGQIVEQFKEPLMNATKGALTWLSEHGDELGSTLASIADAAVRVVGALSDWADRVIERMDQLINGTKEYQEAAAVEGGPREGESWLDYAERIKGRMDQNAADKAEWQTNHAPYEPWFEGDTTAVDRPKQVAIQRLRHAREEEGGGDVPPASAPAPKIEVAIVTSPDGAFTTARDGATGRTLATTTTVDGRRTVAAVG